MIVVSPSSRAPGHRDEAVAQRHHLPRYGFDIELRRRYPQTAAALYHLRRAGNCRQSRDEVGARHIGLARGRLCHQDLAKIS
ncbi:MAG: hypothetical protein WBX30_31765 [Stellaceae bacterium]